MERIFELASFLSQLPSVGGMELDAADAVKNYCESMNLFDEIRIIPTGTVLAYCRSGKKHAKTLLLDDAGMSHPSHRMPAHLSSTSLSHFLRLDVEERSVY